MRHLKLFLSFYICLLGSPLLAQPDTTEVDLGGESVEVSGFSSPVQQLTSQQRWFQFFTQIDSINIAPSFANSHPGNDALAHYEELPVRIILRDYQALQHYLANEVFASQEAAVLLDSTVLVARQAEAIKLTAYRAEGDTSALSDRERSYGMKRILGDRYPLSRAKFWRKVDWEPRLLRKDVMSPGADLNNPYFLAALALALDSLTGKLMAIEAAFAAYSSVENMVYFLRQGLSNTSSSVNGTWFVRLMRPIRRQVDAKADSWYAARDAALESDGFMMPRSPEPWLEKELVAEVLTDSLEEYHLRSLQAFHDQLERVYQGWSDQYQLLDSLVNLHRDSLSALEFDFCEASLAELQTQLDFVGTARKAVAQIMMRTKEDPSYARLGEMLQVYSQLRDHYIGNARSIEDVYRNERLNALAQQVHEYYLAQVWELERTFLDEVRRIHRP